MYKIKAARGYVRDGITGKTIIFETAEKANVWIQESRRYAALTGKRQRQYSLEAA